MGSLIYIRGAAPLTRPLDRLHLRQLGRSSGGVAPTVISDNLNLLL